MFDTHHWVLAQTQGHICLSPLLWEGCPFRVLEQHKETKTSVSQRLFGGSLNAVMFIGLSSELDTSPTQFRLYTKVFQNLSEYLCPSIAMTTKDIFREVSQSLSKCWGMGFRRFTFFSWIFGILWRLTLTLSTDILVSMYSQDFGSMCQKSNLNQNKAEKGGFVGSYNWKV